jgi:succinate dehydrogenase / fumarate reductase, cytochrome b subunit
LRIGFLPGNPQSPAWNIMNKPRPKHLNLFKIRFPVMAIVSGMHRISGAVLFLFLPLFLWMLQTSLESRQSFEAIGRVAANPFVKILLLGLLWGYVHHLFAGIRHLALDLHIGIELASARASSMAVMVVSIGVTLGAAVALW